MLNRVKILPKTSILYLYNTTRNNFRLSKIMFAIFLIY